jgi:hypothetical protein
MNRAISDADGPTVAKWFYEELFAKEVVDADSVAYALDSAAGKLRGLRSYTWERDENWQLHHKLGWKGWKERARDEVGLAPGFTQ